jgi:cephalosporin hydroxylase
MGPISNARAASDTRHRIDAANSRPRRIKLVGLGHGGAAIVTAIETARFCNVQVLVPGDDAVALSALADAEMIFMVACSGDDVTLAPQVKQIGRAANVSITGVLVQAGAAQAELPVLRAGSDMLVVATDASYVTDMLAQLGA